jgi:Uma2 family endonuclease
VEPAFAPRLDHLITEDHQPVKRILVEKQYRLLTHPLYANWPGPGRPFLVLANVGWFYRDSNPAVSPDCLLSVDVTCPENLHVKEGRSYYQWIMGKPPDVIIEIVSDRSGGEDSTKMTLYARQGVANYAIYDPEHHLSEDTLRTYELVSRSYRLVDNGPWPSVALGLRLWQGSFEGVEETWLRWCDADGNLVATGEERATQAETRATQAEQRARDLEEELRRLKEGLSPPTS